MTKSNNCDATPFSCHRLEELACGRSDMLGELHAFIRGSAQPPLQLGALVVDRRPLAADLRTLGLQGALGRLEALSRRWNEKLYGNENVDGVDFKLNLVDEPTPMSTRVL